MAEIVERFMAKVCKCDSGCWEWAGTYNSDGYGLFWYLGKNQRAHRISHLLFVSDPSDKFVCHRCDNPKCVNPEHLFLGDHGDNARDMASKGRQVFQRRPELVRGSRNSQSKLTEDDVRQIRAMRQAGIISRRIAEQFGVKTSTIHSINAKRNWKHLAS